jgi:hypothetical protein
MGNPLDGLTDTIRYAIAEHIRTLGGAERDIEELSASTAYVVWCWLWSNARRG